MSYFFAMVLVDNPPDLLDTAQRQAVLDKVGRLLAPYREGRKLAPHKAYLDDAVVLWGSQPDLHPQPDYEPHSWLLDMARSCADTSDPAGRPKFGHDSQGYFYWTKSNPRGYWNSHRLGGDYNRMIRRNTPKILDHAATAHKKAELEAAHAPFWELKYESTVTRPNERYDAELAKDYFANNTCIVRDLPEDIETYALRQHPAGGGFFDLRTGQPCARR